MEANSRNLSFYIKRITGIILLLALSAVFLFSAGSKLWVIQPFEWSFTDILPVNITVAAVMARLFIGLEIMIGLFLLAHIFLKKFTYKATISLLILLTIYLIVLIAKTGNNGNCGCFGDAMQMKPLAAIWKNLVMIAVTIALIYIYPVRPYKKQIWVAIILALASFTVPFILQPVYIFSPSKLVHEPVDLNPIYMFAKPVPTVDLRKGKHVVAFFSLTCPHCRNAGRHMQMLYKQYPDLPFYAILGGHQSDLKDFLKDTRTTTLPYSLLENWIAFGRMAGNSVPAIYWINNGVIERKSYYSELEPKLLRDWLK